MQQNFSKIRVHTHTHSTLLILKLHLSHHWDTTTHVLKNDFKLILPSAGKEVKKLKCLYPVPAGANAKLWNHFKNGLVVFENIDTGLLYSPSIPFPGIYPREMTSDVHTKTRKWILTAALSLIGEKKIGVKTKYLSMGKWIKSYSTFIDY